MRYFTQERQNRFSIRKLTIGAVSVMFGSLLLFTTQTSPAHAAEEDANATTVTTDVQSNNQTVDQHTQTANSQSSSSTTQSNTQQNETNADEGFTNQKPEAGNERFNKDDQKQAPAVLNQDIKHNQPTVKDNNGVKLTTKVVATNQNNQQESEVSGSDNETNDIPNTAIINTDVTNHAKLVININNTSDADQNISGSDYWIQLPAWFGTNAKIKVDSSVIKNGRIVFGGDYHEKGLSTINYGIATSDVGSSGYSKSEAEAAVDPTKIAGFMISGTLHAGDIATLEVPLDITSPMTSNESMGVLYGISNQVKGSKNIASLASENGRHYFLYDLSTSSNGNYHSVSQDIIDDLLRNGIYPTYQTGDANVDNNGQYLTNSSSYSLNDAVSRINQVLNGYGYQVINPGEQYKANELNNHYYDAEGNEIKLGTGNYSDFFIPVQRIIKQKANTSLVIDRGSSAPNFNQIFESASGMQITGSVDTSKDGVYSVKVVSTSNPKISREYKFVVVSYQEPDAYKLNDNNHHDLTVDSVLTSDSIRNLQASGYTIAWQTAPDYTEAGEKNVEVAITSVDGKVHVGHSKVNVLQAINIHFKKDGQEVGSVIRLYGKVGENLSNQLAEITASPIYQDLQNEFGRDYNFDLSQVQTAIFASQKDDQTVDVNLTAKKVTEPDDSSNSNPDNNVPTPTPNPAPSETSSTQKPASENAENDQSTASEVVAPHPQATPKSNKHNRKTSVHAAKRVKNSSQKSTTLDKHANNSLPANLSSKQKESSLKVKSSTLPQTGEKNNQFALIGMAFAAVAAILGLEIGKRKIIKRICK